MEIDWVSVQSDRITAYAYDQETATIFVTFTDGVMWRYFDCSAEVWEQFQFAPSKGRFIREVLDHHQHGPA